MNYYYADSANQPVGPLPLEEIHGLARNGTIGLDTHVLAEGGEEWQPYRTLLPILPPSSRSVVPIGRYSPIIELTPTPRPVAVPATKECPFCAESVAVAAKKCKHCGEIIDVTLRAAEEGKRARSQQPMVFMNAGGASSSSSASSAAVVVVGRRKKRSGCGGCILLAILGFILLVIIANADKSSRQTTPRPTPIPVRPALRP